MRKSLLLKIIIPFLLVTVFLFGLLSYLSFSNQQKELTKSFTSRAQATIYSLESCIAGKSDFQDTRRFFNSIQKSMFLDQDINGISFNLFDDGKLKTVISSDQTKVGQEDKGKNLDAFNNQKVISEVLSTRSGNVLSVISPLSIAGHLEGTIEINFSLRNTERQTAAVTIKLLAYYLIIFVFFAILSYFFLRRKVIKPILNLKSAVTEVNKGNLSFRIKNETADELGQLSDDFNKMAIALELSQKKMEDYNKELQKEVASKTKELQAAKSQLEGANVVLEKKVQNRIAELEALKSQQEQIIKERTDALNIKLAELERMNGYMINRELKMVELKKEITDLKKKLNK